MEEMEDELLIESSLLLKYIPPDCDYDEWIKVGMALKHEGESCDTWDRWSAGGSKYKQGECQRKWRSFNRDDVTGGTLYHIAAEYGYAPEKEDVTGYDIHNLLLDEAIIDPSFTGSETVPPVPKKYNAKGEVLEYLETLFKPEEFVGYCTQFYLDEKDKKFKPSQTIFRRTAGNIIEMLKSGKTIEQAFGTLNPNAGAYIRFNPLDGKGENNSNVTRWKHCLVESDADSLEKQYGIYKAMNLPITFLVNSGGKSLHAIVRIDAENEDQYKVRVRDLYAFCKKSGLTTDEQDKNASRFSRLPGVKRGDNWQYIVARNIGAASYDEWIEWRESQADDLPPETNLGEVWNNMPPLKDELINGVLRVSHKMLVAGPSKAGKSFLLIELAIAIAEGIEWLGVKCKQGKVCYVNLELDSASCLRRFREVYERLDIEPKNLKNITVWNLRGKSVPMDKLAPVLVHRFKESNYLAAIIDPIYKVITGDENNATDMSKFCSYFDQVATEMNTAVIYCHHHSKGASGKYSNSADRSSGSGVFARDPDAILDLRELSIRNLDEKYRADNPAACEVLTAWEVSGTLREFAPMQKIRVWFDYPVHVVDKNNYLGVATYSDSIDSGKGIAKGQQSKQDSFEIVEELLAFSLDTAVTIEQIGISAATAKKKFGTETIYELATVAGEKVVHLRDEDSITFQGKRYERVPHGSHSKWEEIV